MQMYVQKEKETRVYILAINLSVSNLRISLNKTVLTLENFDFFQYNFLFVRLNFIVHVYEEINS